MDEKIDELLNELDSIARAVDPYDYGLPFGNESKIKMRECIWNWLITNGLIEVYKPKKIPR